MFTDDDDGRVEHVADINIDSPQTATDVSTTDNRGQDRANNYLLINTATSVWSLVSSNGIDHEFSDLHSKCNPSAD